MGTKTEAAPSNIAGQQITIPAPNFQVGRFLIRGTAPLVQNAFSAKAREQMRLAQSAGHTGKKGRAKRAKDFAECYNNAIHRSTEGWFGVPAPAFRNAMIAACRMTGYAMTRAKQSVFVEADGFDASDGTPLVRITKGEPEYSELSVRNESGVADLRPRPMWREWQLSLNVRFDADQFTLEDVSNLLARAGLQVGIGEGRPASKKSAGMGWGLFEIAGAE